MKLLLIFIPILASCASPVTAPSVEALQAAKPKPTIQANTQPLAKQLDNSAQVTAKAKNSVVIAKGNTKELSKQLEQAQSLNREFSDAVKKLSIEKADVSKQFDDFRQRYEALTTRLQSKVSQIYANLRLAETSLTEARILNDQSHEEIRKLTKESAANYTELERYRSLYAATVKQVGESAKSAQHYKSEAMKNQTYKTLFWRFIWFTTAAILLIAAAIYLHLKFNIFRNITFR